MRVFAEAWSDADIVQQAVGQLPWGHNLVQLTRLKDPQQRLAHAQSAMTVRKFLESADKTIKMDECLYCLDCQVIHNDATVCPPLVNEAKRNRKIVVPAPTRIPATE
jgi:hypothetical protein